MMKKVLVIMTLLVLYSSLAYADLTTDSIVEYTFNDNQTTGTTVEDTLNNYDGTNNGAVTGATGILKQAYDFDTETDYIDVSSWPAMSTFGNSWTFAYWINVDANPSGTEDVHFSLRSTTGGGTQVVHQTSGSLDFYIFDGSLRLPISVASVDLATGWNHLVWVNSPAGTRFYRNGTLIDSGVSYTPAGNYGTLESIGGLSAGGYAPVGLMDAFQFWDRNLSQDEITELYNLGSGLEYPFIGNFTIIPENYVNGSSIQVFNATVNGTFYNTTTGSIITGYPNEGVVLNVTVESEEYFRVINEVNLSSDYEPRMYQAIARFYAKEIITDDNVSQGNFTGGSVTNETLTNFYLNAGLNNITFSHVDYYNKTAEYNLTSLSNQTYNLSGVYNHIVNATLYSVANQSLINDFNITVEGINEVYTETYSTSIGYQDIPLLTNNYSLTISSSDYATVNATLNLTGTYTPHQFNTSTRNSINITIKDESTLETITGINIQVVAYSDLEAQNKSTSTGNIYFDFLTPETYTLLFEPESDYGQREYSLEVSPFTTQTFTAYLINTTDSDDVRVTVQDLNGVSVEGARVTLYRFYPESITYQKVSSLITDSNGEVIFSVILNGPKYKFLVEQNDNIVFESSNPVKITKTTVTLTISSTVEIDDGWNEVLQTNHNLYFTTSTNNFTFTWTGNTASNGRLEVIKTNYSSRDLTISDVSSSVTDGTLTVNVNNDTIGTYVARAYLTINNVEYLVDQEEVSFNTKPDGLKSIGWIVSFVILLLISLLGNYNPVVMLTFHAFALVGLKIIGFLPLSGLVVSGLVGVILITIFIIGDKA